VPIGLAEFEKAGDRPCRNVVQHSRRAGDGAGHRARERPGGRFGGGVGAVNLKLLRFSVAGLVGTRGQAQPCLVEVLMRYKRGEEGGPVC